MVRVGEDSFFERVFKYLDGLKPLLFMNRHSIFVEVCHYDKTSKRCRSRTFSLVSGEMKFTR